MNKKALKKLAESNLMAILDATLTKGFAQGRPESRSRIKKGEIRRLKVKSWIARNLFTASDIVAERRLELMKKHNALHDKGALPPGFCQEFKMKMAFMEVRSKLLRDLAWLAVGEEHPLILGNALCLRAGWNLVTCVGDTWNPQVKLKFKPGSVAATLTTRLQQIFAAGEQGGAPVLDLPPVREGEKVIAILNNRSLQAIRVLASNLSLSAMEGIPSPSKNRSSFLSWILGQSSEQVLATENFAGAHMFRLEILMQVFNLGVLELLPQPHPDRIHVRTGWKIVSIPPTPPTPPRSEVLEIVIVRNDLPSTGFLFPGKRPPGRG